MKPILLEKIDRVDDGVLVTVVSTEGHTYKKRGAKALFRATSPLPAHGNLGSLCVDQEIQRQSREAFEAGTPRIITIDTSDPEDVHFGYGTYCGGKLELLLEPILEEQKRVYRQVRDLLADNCEVELTHDVGGASGHPGAETGSFVELLKPAIPLCIFGATPLAMTLAWQIRDLHVQIRVFDWRKTYLATFETVPHVETHLGPARFDERSLAVIVSHSFDRDLDALAEAISMNCPYIGLLSSSRRRAALYESLEERGIPRSALDRINSPIGIGGCGRSDPEIAVSIAAELARFLNDHAGDLSGGRARHALRSGYSSLADARL